MVEPSPWTVPCQLGVVVRDLDAAVRHYEAMGVGPFREGPSEAAVERWVHGERVEGVVVAGRITQLGPLEFELISPVTGPSLQAEYLERYGEGPMHLCSLTDDIERDTELLLSAGAVCVARARFPDDGVCAFFDTGAYSRLLLELYQPTDPVMLDNFARLKAVEIL